MKLILTPVLKSAALALLLSLSGAAYAQSTVTTTTTSEGTISEYTPQGLVITSSGGAEPLRYTSDASTVYVDESGNPVATSVVRSGLPVTVHYTRVGDTLTASRVIVRKTAAVVPAPAPVIEKSTTTTVREVRDEDDDED